MRRLEQCVLRAEELAVASQLDALLAEDLGGRRLLVLESTDPAEFERWARVLAAGP